MKTIIHARNAFTHPLKCLYLPLTLTAKKSTKMKFLNDKIYCNSYHRVPNIIIIIYYFYILVLLYFSCTLASNSNMLTAGEYYIFLVILSII